MENIRELLRRNRDRGRIGGDDGRKYACPVRSFGALAGTAFQAGRIGHLVSPARRTYLRCLAARLSRGHDQKLPPLLERRNRRLDRATASISASTIRCSRLETTFDRDDFTRVLTGRFQVPAENVKSFFDAARNMNFFDDQTTTTGQFFEKYFPGRSDVVRLLMEPITYANGSTLEDPALTYGIVFSNFMSKGVYTFQGGTDRLIGLMRDDMLKQRRRCSHIVQGGANSRRRAKG